MSRSRIIGGTAGLVSAILSGRVCPFTGEIVDYGRRWPSGRLNWYDAARREREDKAEAAKAERRAMGRGILADPPPYLLQAAHAVR